MVKMRVGRKRRSNVDVDVDVDVNDSCAQGVRVGGWDGV
jgi:hypothetical protein